MAEYIGGRIVPVHGGVWNRSKSYEELTIVLREETGDSYISRKPVPAGTEITEERFWALYSQYSEQIAIAEQNMNSTAGAIRGEMDAQSAEVEQRMEQAEDLSNRNRTAVEARMDVIEARQDANVTASTDASADYAAEVVDARIGADETDYASAGTHLRSVANGYGLTTHGVTRDKISDLSFEQLDFGGLDVFSFSGLVITKGKQLTGFNTSTYLPAYGNTSSAAVKNGCILDFPISNLVERHVTKLYIPMGAPHSQKTILYTEGTKATNTAHNARDPVDGRYEILISTLTKYDRMAVSFAQGSVYLDAERDLAEEPARRIRHWIDGRDLKEGAVAEENLEESLANQLPHYPFDRTKPTDWQTVKGKHFQDGAVRYVRIYECDPNLDYGLSRVWANHVSLHTRTVGIASFDRVTHEQIELLGSYTVENENQTAPDFVEVIEIMRQGKPLADLVFDWPKELRNDGDSREIFCTGVCLPEQKIDRNYLDDLYEITDGRVDDIMQRGFPFTGNIVSPDTGLHRVSRVFDTTTKLPVWQENDNYREFTIPCPKYGYWHISRNNPTDTQGIQRYGLGADGKVLINFSDKQVREENWAGISVTEEEMHVNCAAAYARDIRFFSFTFDIRNLPAFYIRAEGNYVPGWLGVEQIRSEAGISSSIEMILPSRLRICAGVEMNLYYQNVLRYCDADKCQLVKAKGSFDCYSQFARFTPEAGSSGTFNSGLQLYLKDTLTADLQSPTMAVSYFPETVGSGATKKILCMGDSLTDADAYTSELITMFGDDPMNIELLGTLGSGSNHNEGYSGWRAYTFAKCSGQRADWATWSSTVPTERVNPFWNAQTEAFDFSMYMANQGYDHVDYVFICLGTNDIARGNHKTEAELQEYFDTIISGIHDYDENIRIGLWLPPTRSLMANRNRQSIDSSLWMNKWLISTYDNREDERIYLVPVYLNVDPYHDYRASVVPVSARNTDYTMTVDLDSVHPARVGYKKIADVIYSYIKYFASLDG